MKKSIIVLLIAVLFAGFAFAGTLKGYAALEFNVDLQPLTADKGTWGFANLTESKYSFSFEFDTTKVEVKGEGEYNYIPEGRQIQWVIKEYMNDENAETAGNGLGVFYFPVAEGCKYYAHATGSKISWSGIYFSETEAAKVEVTGETEEGGAISKVLVGNTSGIQTVKNAINTNGAIYHLAGQKVGANYKGLVIKNGKKMIQ